MKKLLNFRPIFFIAVSMCVGISATYFLLQENLFWSIFLFSSFIICNVLYLALFTTKENIKEKLIFFSVFTLVFVIGCQNIFVQINNYNKADLNGQMYQITAKVVQVYNKDSNTNVILDDVTLKREDVFKSRYKISLVCYGETYVDIGDIVSFSANLTDNSYIYEDSFNVYDIERDIKYSATISSNSLQIIDNKTNIFESINIFIRDTLMVGLDDQEFAVAYAMLTGDSNFMDSDLAESYRNAGVAHIFAVSGLHIGFLAAVLTFIFKKIDINKMLKALIIIILLLFYSGICGFTASSLRATVMTAVALFSVSIGKRYDGVSALSLSAIIILLFSPMQLLCVGFQLSFMVVFGIITTSNNFAKLFRFLPYKLSSAIGAVLSAQIFSIPISLYSFGQFSTIAVLINLIFIPVVSVIFIFTIVATILGGIFSISQITLFPIKGVFKLINLLIGFFDLDIFLIGGFALGGIAIVYYLIFLIYSGFFNLKGKFKLITCIALSVITIFSTLGFNAIDSNKIKVQVTYTDSISATMISTEGENTLIVSNVKYVFTISKLKRMIKNTGDKIDNLVLMGGYNPDLQVILTKLHFAFDVEKVYYYGEKQQAMEEICKKSFTKTKLYNYQDGKSVELSNMTIISDQEGCVLTTKVKNKNICVLSYLEKVEPNLNYLPYNTDLMVCLDRADVILNKYSPVIGISYRYSSIYKNAQENGNIMLKLT